MSEDQIYKVVIGTAGHIDHGKSSIVRRLTGIDPDRLPEERNRGLTIDLGFAPMKLPSGETVGIIDVPGHERFIKNMVAGASGIDLVVLVVAADDSVMPQTREHLDIMTLLGIQRGIVVINKIDLVEEDMIELVEEEIRELVEGTFLEEAPIFPISAETGAGFDEFQAYLLSAIDEVPKRASDGVFRLPVQRVFSAKGFGTVVTGVPVSGEVKIGDRLELLPLEQEGRVRGLQAYKITVDRAQAGHSAAINLSDVDYREVTRGMVAATPGYFRATTMVEVRLRVLPGQRPPVRHQMRVRFHSGTAETVGSVYLLNSKVAHPGEETFAQFRLEEPIVVAPGDRYVFRQESPMLTLGGGEILDRSSWRLKLGKDYVLENLERKEAALGSREEFVLSVLEESPFQVTGLEDVARHAGLPRDDVAGILTGLHEEEKILPGGKPNTWLACSGVNRTRKRVEAALEQAYEQDPYRLAVPKLEVLDQVRVPSEFLDEVLTHLANDGIVATHKGGTVSLPNRTIELSDAEQAARQLIVDQFQEHKFAPPQLDALAESHSTPLDTLSKIQDLLIAQGELTRVDNDVVLHASAVEDGIGRLKKLYEEEGAFKAARAKDVLETSRKFAIPFLEYLDRLKVTRRRGDQREVV